MPPPILSAAFGLLLALLPQQDTGTVYTYPQGIDAVSVRFEVREQTAEVSYGTPDGWSDWNSLEIDDDQDPALLESDMVMLPRNVTAIRIRGDVAAVHPIRVSQNEVSYRVASLVALGTPRILTRRDWGADDSLLLRKESSSSSSSSETSAPEKTDATEDPRERDCLDAQLNYPNEFKASTPITTNEKGEKLRWPLQYSPSIKLLAVHHTAGKVTEDGRSGAERMRAIYQYHAQNRGWGDVGYHYIIDEDGRIYEGRQGGDFVVAGHAYCHNVGSIGVALMGNFDVEQPTQVQTQSLQWLLRTLAEKYNIDLGRQVQFHGKTFSPVVGHRELVSTSCPGATLWAAFNQVRSNVRSGDTGAKVTYPELAAASSRRSSSSRRTQDALRPAAPPAGASGLRALGSTTIEGRPDGEVQLTLLYSPDGPKKKGAKIAAIKRSTPRLKLFSEKDGKYEGLRGSLILDKTISESDAVAVRIKVELPPERTTHTVIIGDITYTITAEGKRVRTGPVAPTRQSYFRESVPQRTAPVTPAVTHASSSSARRVTVSPPPAALPPTHAAPGDNPLIRIKLNDASLAQGIATIEAASLTLEGASVTGPVAFDRDGTQCRASAGGKAVRSGDALRLNSGNGVLSVTTFRAGRQRFRGTMECRVLDGALVLINELPLEDYMAGLAEEPDSEPYEKQRAFAVAARTYAAYYLDPAHRKFPGKPYDGSDSPAEFQLYSGLDFEQKNPAWVRAVKGTATQVLKVGTEVLRAPYFSTDDGRTRTPEEAGWKNFPHPHVFVSKPDPWCQGMPMRGHGVGMSGCGAGAQAREGKKAEEILGYYYPGTTLGPLGTMAMGN